MDEPPIVETGAQTDFPEEPLPIRPPTPSGSEGHTDVAALAAGAVAVAVSVIAPPGPFDVNGAMIAITLSIVILSYIWKNQRTVWQSLAVGMLLGVILIPVIGFLVEVYAAENRWHFFTLSDTGVCKAGSAWRSCSPLNMRKSSTNNLWQIGTWITVGALVFAADRRGQRFK